jgi:hypothetical protein
MYNLMRQFGNQRGETRERGAAYNLNVHRNRGRVVGLAERQQRHSESLQDNKSEQQKKRRRRI